MTPLNRELGRRAAAAVGSMMSMLSENVMAGVIDQPIDQAIEQFRFDWPFPVTAASFHQAIGNLMRAILQAMTRPHFQTPARWLCQNMAVNMLESSYQGNSDIGYEGALADAMSCGDVVGPDGIDGVLIQLAQILKGYLRELYTQRVLTRFLDPWDPELKLGVIRHIQQQYAYMLPDDLLHAQPYELVTHIPALLATIREVRETASHWAIDPLE